MKFFIKKNITNKKIIISSIVLSMILFNTPINSFANEFMVKNFDKFDSWEVKVNMPTSRGSLTTAVVDGKIYCIGGANDSVLNKVEVYDPVKDSWETKANMPTARSHLTSVVVNDKIYVFGGANGSSLSTVEVYNTKTDSWSTGASMPTARHVPTSEIVDGKIYVIGGKDSVSSSFLNIVEVYDPVTDSWETRTSMPTKRDGITSGVVDGKIYVFGGWTTGCSYLNTVEMYDPVTDSWETRASMLTGRSNLTSAVVNDKIYCIGGWSGSSKLNLVEVYDPKTDSWETKNSMPTARSHLSSKGAVINNKIYVIGGTSDSALNTVEVYTIPFDMTLNKETVSANSDIYIKPKNALSLSLDTNSIVFDEVDATESIERLNAVNLSVISSLPYKINAYLEEEIYNSDKTEILDKSILNIRASNTSEYEIFTGLSNAITLLDNQEAGVNNEHGVDLKLVFNSVPKVDIYKTTIKFEAEQK